METGEGIFEKIYASPRPPSEISLKHDWMKELGPEMFDNQREKLRNNPKVPNQAKDIAQFSRFNTAVWLRMNFYKRWSITTDRTGSKGKPKLCPCWKLHLVICTVNMELRSESCP